jgi:hypothetical protein
LKIIHLVALVFMNVQCHIWNSSPNRINLFSDHESDVEMEKDGDNVCKEEELSTNGIINEIENCKYTLKFIPDTNCSYTSYIFTCIIL